MNGRIIIALAVVTTFPLDVFAAETRAEKVVRMLRENVEALKKANAELVVWDPIAKSAAAQEKPRSDESTKRDSGGVGNIYIQMQPSAASAAAPSTTTGK